MTSATGGRGTSKTKDKPNAGTQTLARGLDVIGAVAGGATSLTLLSSELGLTRSTVHRLASALVEHRYLSMQPRGGYALGPKLLELGYLAAQQMSLTVVAREHLEQLSLETGDTVHLGVLDGMRALYLEKMPGRRRVEISSRVGDRQPLRSTGLGKALILDEAEATWREFYKYEEEQGGHYTVPQDEWLDRMRRYAASGIAFDLEENEDRIRCVAAPVRGVSGDITGAISVSSAAQYIDDERMQSLAKIVGDAAHRISESLGWNGQRSRTGR